ncbi:phosphatidylglycerol lysyltransferase domain-containing protein [Streptomyces sp. NPDC093252]|uniref:phosphatidylglycerol lysyltransferase domain-containing protein n=1 Tax=Streptomyces sp. NPDC093252 TaxID=3154980 RepID=UPI00342B60BD
MSGTAPARAGRVRRRLRGPHPRSVPVLVAGACALVGLLDIAAGVFPRFRHSRAHALAEVLPGALGPFAAALSLSAGVLLLLLARGLRRRKRRAWRAAVALLPVGAVAQFAYRHSLAGVLLALALLWVLLRHRGQFAALPDPRSRWRALANFVLMGAGSLALGLVIVSVHQGPMVGDPSWAARLTHVLYGLLGVQGPVDYKGSTSWTVAASLGALGLLTAVTTVYLAFRPEHPAARLSEDDEQRLRALLERHGGRDLLGHFALRRDRAVVFSPSGKAAVTYRVVSGVMLADGDPIGDMEAWPGAMERFMDVARAHSWTPAVMGCSETGGEVWTRETGLDALEPGDEAVVDVPDFSLAGRAMRNVRRMVTRIERAGYETRVRRVRDLGAAGLDRIRRAADDWRGTATERGFSMALGRVGDPAVGDCLIATAHRAEAEPGPYGDLRAVLHFVPWGGDGVSLDLMRRDRAADPKLNELLTVAALRAAPRFGISRVSLNFAMVRSAPTRGGRIGAGPVLRAWRGLLLCLSRWFRIESLYRFNATFRPRWEPRFVVYRASADLPRIGVAALRAEGFLTAPPLPLRRRTTPARPRAHGLPERDVRTA